MFDNTSAPAGGNCAVPLLEVAEDDDPEPPADEEPEDVVELDVDADELVDPDELVEDDPPVVVDGVPDEVEEEEDEPDEVGVNEVAELLGEADELNWVVVVPTDDLVRAVEPPHPVM